MFHMWEAWSIGRTKKRGELMYMNDQKVVGENMELNSESIACYELCMGRKPNGVSL